MNLNKKQKIILIIGAILLSFIFMLIGTNYDKETIFMVAGMPTILMTIVLIIVFKDKTKAGDENKQKINKNGDE